MIANFLSVWFCPRTFGTKLFKHSMQHDESDALKHYPKIHVIFIPDILSSRVPYNHQPTGVEPSSRLWSVTTWGAISDKKVPLKFTDLGDQNLGAFHSKVVAIAGCSSTQMVAKIYLQHIVVSHYTVTYDYIKYKYVYIYIYIYITTSMHYAHVRMYTYMYVCILLCIHKRHIYICMECNVT